MKPSKILKKSVMWSFAVSLLVAGLFVTRGAAQTEQGLSERVAWEWTKSEKGSTTIGERVAEKLKSSGSVEIVEDSKKADAVIRGSATFWVTGHESSSTRSKATQHALYSGFAQMEVSGKDGQVLWSYLATRRAGWKKLTDDLADQLAHEFLVALAKKNEERGGAGNTGDKGGNGARVSLHGAGATFPAPMYQKWFETFRQGHTEIEIQYDAVGSAEGARRVIAGETDFGASDMPLSSEQLNSPKRRLVQVATMVGAVVPIYNVAGAPDGLNLTPEILAGIFSGMIQRWDAPEIKAINKRAHLPSAGIEVIHRSDGSGTTYAWTEYLSKVSAEWKAKLGAGTTVNWPVGIGAEGNDGVAATVQKTANSIGYVEFLYALQHELDFAAVRNASGEYVRADLDSVSAAAKTVGSSTTIGSDRSITNPAGKHVYPIATLTWLLIPVDGDAAKTTAMRDLVRWMLTTGQRQCEGLGYAALPSEFAGRQLQAVAELH